MRFNSDLKTCEKYRSCLIIENSEFGRFICLVVGFIGILLPKAEGFNYLLWLHGILIRTEIEQRFMLYQRRHIYKNKELSEGSEAKLKI